jgi:intracellular septation protein A
VNLSLSWAILWRVLVVEMLFALAIILIARDSALFTDVSLVVWKPSVIWGSFSCAVVIGQLTLSNGLLHVLWGSRLQQDRLFWRRLGYGTAGLGFVIAALNLAIISLVSFEQWVGLKTFGPLLLAVAFAFAAPALMVTRSNPSLQRTASPPAEL